jgi:carbamoyltransferase
MTRILGVSSFFHDAAAALLVDGELVAAGEEERFTRIKHDYSFPVNAINYCLEVGEVTGADLDYVVFFEKPFVKFDRIIRTVLQSAPLSYKLWVQSMRTWLIDKLWVKSRIAKELGIDTKKILFSEHHLSHAASSYFTSPFDDAAILTIDGVGEWATTSIGIGKGNHIELIEQLHFPHSIGLLYSAFTAWLGFEINEGEYKVMGMAPYGQPKYVDEVRQVVLQNDDGSFWMDPSFFSYHFSTTRSYTAKFVKLFGEPRDPDRPFVTETSGYASYYEPAPADMSELYEYNQHYADVAASIQLVTEQLVLGLANRAYELAKVPNLCMAGGVALNSVANGRILRETPFENLHIQPAAGDAGGALGAALYAWHASDDTAKPRWVMKHAYWGSSYTPEEIASAIQDAGLEPVYVEDDDALIARTADLLIDGRVVGWFQGAAEFGPRALGNRSILADPRKAETKDLVNTKIKFREPFRPFAPSVLAERASEYFEIDDAEEVLPARFMLLVTKVKEDKQDLIPAVSHLGTARLQTVHREVNPRYYDLIARFAEKTGVPMVLNTSFNVRGEPIVNSPQDALNTFAKSGIDVLVMGNYIIDKSVASR